ncbi:MAG: hypothetical protein WCV86_05460, partial [Patescibacteria group bacterium]
MDDKTAKPAAPANAKQDDFQQAYSQGGKFKEQLEAIAGAYGRSHGGGVEAEPVARVEKPVEAIQEVPTSPELEKKPELSGYIEKVEREAETMKPIVDDYTQQVLLKSSDPMNTKVKLPMTEEQVQLGL